MAASDFPTWFKKIRESKGLTQIQAAEELDISSPTISRWEDGTEPRAKHLTKISRWAPIAPEKLLALFR
jgi:transcriptional regulator with XRE-family HTH domain